MKIKKKPIIGDIKRKIISMRNSSRKNKDGTESTHLMAYGGSDEEGYDVHPTLFPNKDGSWTDYSSKESGRKAYDEALKRGEVIGGLSKKMAKDLARGSWKNMGKISIKKKNLN